MRPIITLTTDFGTHDSYVGVMKGVILGLCPDAQLIDITHHVSPQNVVEAMFVIQTFVRYFPVATVHLVVVDPGVGSSRRPVLVTTPDAYFVGPDNGVFTEVWNDGFGRWSKNDVHAYVLDNQAVWQPHVSATFHGRDIFAPVAAHLARRAEPTTLGTPIDSIVTLPMPAPVWEHAQRVCGEVIYIDHFGNCITNITIEHMCKLGPHTTLWVDVEGVDQIPIKYTYADVASGQALALIGSTPRIEIAVCNGHASQALGIVVGTRVRVEVCSDQAQRPQ